MDELSNTYTLTHSPDGWRVHFSSGVAPGFGLEPHYNLFEVIDRVETLYPEYRPQPNHSAARGLSASGELAAGTPKNSKRSSRRQVN